MESIIGRYRNLTILAALLFGQVLALAIQVQRPTENRSTRLIRIWAVSAVTPLEKGIVGIQNGMHNLWRNYFYLRGVRQENRDLKKKIQDLEIDRVRLSEDAEQAHRLQALLGFKEQYISQTVAAQVIGSSGSEQSRSVYIDKGARDGVKADMAVITSDGIVGKVLRTFKTTSQVLLINDQTSGVGAILEKSRLQGVLRGTPAGEVVLEKVMSDEEVKPGEQILTSGGDQIFPKGLPVGTVTKVAPGQELFLNIRVKPTADLTRLEEVLVITEKEDREPAIADNERLRASDILAQRLPSVPDKPAGATNPSGATGTPAGAGAASSAKPGTTSPATQTASTSGKPAVASTTPKPAPNAGSNVPATNAVTAQKPPESTPKQTVNPTSTPPHAATVKHPIAPVQQPGNVVNQVPGNSAPNQAPVNQPPASPIPSNPPPDQPQ